MDLARLHRPLVRVAPASTMPERDGLAAEDDLMCRRLRHCTQCGRGAVPGDHQAVVYIPGRIVAARRRTPRWPRCMPCCASGMARTTERSNNDAHTDPGAA